MREKRNYCVITFSKTTEAMAFEKRCMAEGIPGRIIPLPVIISAGCGLAWRMTEEDYSRYSDSIKGYEGVYTLEM